MSSGGGGPVDCTLGTAADGLAIGEGVGLSRCHGHFIAVALLDSRAMIDNVAKMNRGGRELFIDGD